MKKLKQTSILYVAFTLFLISVLSSCGPSNYEDCVLDKMKGQNKTMISVARKVCEKRFPYEKELYFYGRNLEFNWGYYKSRMYLIIEKNYGEYTITRCRVNLSKKPCNETTDSDYILKKTFVFSSGNKASVSIEDADYKCMSLDTIWGKLRK